MSSPGAASWMTTGGSRGHAIIVRRLAAVLEKRLDGNRWTVLTCDFGVDLGRSNGSLSRRSGLTLRAVGSRT